MSLFEELKRRNVFKVGIAYLVGSWLMIQLADILLDNIGAPAWVLQTLFVALGVGFFITLFFAWAFEMTPEGVKREKDVDRSQSIAPVTGKKLNTAILVLMAVVIGYLLFDKFSGSGNVGSEPFSQESSSQSASDGGEKRGLTPAGASPGDLTPAGPNQAETEATISRQSIAVLPFDNRSRNVDDEFFVEGIHDDLLTNLARISALKVISRTSVMRYKDTEMAIPDIATELGVATIMEGAVQRSGSTVRINVQLIDANTDEHLWAEIYDRKLTAENLFSIQSEISEAIADALEATLSPQEQQRINTTPTDNLAAYDAYLRGRQLMATRDTVKLKKASEAFTEAVELDPQFALAWVNLADSTRLLSVYGTLSVESSQAIQKNALDRAMAIDDQLGEAYASLGSYLDLEQRHEEAEAAYKRAIELNPNYSTAYHWYSNLLNRISSLRNQETISLARKAVELDPASSIIGSNLAGAYRNQGLYSLAERQYQKMIELDPEFSPAIMSLANLNTFTLGRYDKGVEYARKAIAMDHGNIGNLAALAAAYIQLGDRQAYQATLEQMELLDANHFWTAFVSVLVSSQDDTPAAIRETINWALPRINKTQAFMTMVFASIELGLGDTAPARDIYLALEPGWLQPEQWNKLIDQHGNNACTVAWILIHSGDEALGTQLLERATNYFENTLPATFEHVDRYAPEVCYLTAGDTGKALASIETQAAHNHLFGWHISHKMPMYDAIRDEPRYIAAVAERERRIAEQRAAVAKMDAEAGL